ncbi:MAG: hypothetical protein ABFD24_00780 [Anaerolineaceae bacterium]
MDVAAIVMILAFLISGIATLPSYGVSWDEGLGNMFFGERYLHYLIDHEQGNLDFSQPQYYNKTHPLNLFVSPFRDRPQEFPGLGDIGSAATMYLFAYKLHLMDPVDGFHIFSILVATIFLSVMYFFNSKRLGKWASLLAVIFLAAFPRFWGDMHFNTKDVVETCLFGLSIMAYVSWYEKPGFLRASLFAICFGAAMGVKANAGFIPFILILGIWPWLVHPRQWLANFKHIANYFYQYLWMFNLASLVYFTSWPYLYENPMRALDYFTYILGQGDRTGVPVWSAWPAKMAVSTMPEIMLLCLTAGLVWILWDLFSHKKSPQFQYKWLLLIWLIFPIIRSSMPNIVNFNGIRHFLEFVPATALIAGYGVVESVHWIQEKKKIAAVVASLVLAAGFAVNMIQIVHDYHPYEYIYFNSLIGGQRGAVLSFSETEATDYWAVSYRDGMRWLNDNAPQDSALVVPIGDWLVQLTQPIWLRSDIRLISEDNLQNVIDQLPVYVMSTTDPIRYTPLLKECIERLPPVYEIKIQGFPIMQVFRYQ